MKIEHRVRPHPHIFQRGCSHGSTEVQSRFIAFAAGEKQPHPPNRRQQWQGPDQQFAR